MKYSLNHAKSSVPQMNVSMQNARLSINVESFLQGLPALCEGILRGVFRQQAGVACCPMMANLMVGLLRSQECCKHC